MAQGRPRHQLCLSLCRKDPSSGSCSQKPEGGPEGTNPSNPTSAGAKSSPPISPPGGRAPPSAVPPYTITQHRPSASPGVPDLAAASAIGQTPLSAFSAYERWAPSLAAGGGGRGLRAGRAGPSPFSPASWSLAGRSLWAAGRAAWVTSLRSSAGYSGY